MGNMLDKLCKKFSVKHKNLKAHDEGIWCCAWGKKASTGQEYVITGSLDNGLKVWKWRVDHLEFVRALEGHRLGVISVDINREGTLAASSSLDNQIYLWDLETGASLRTYDGNPADAWTVAFSPDSRFISTGSHSGCLNMIGVESAKKENVIELQGKFTYCLAYVSTGLKEA